MRATCIPFRLALRVTLKVIAVSCKFDGQRLVKRHQLVYSALAAELAGAGARFSNTYLYACGMARKQ